MSLARTLFHDLRPLFRMLEEPLTRSPAYLGGLPARSMSDDPFFQSLGRLRPAVDLAEEGDKYIVEAELPGVRKDDVQVSVGEGGHSLTIEGSVSKRQGPPQDPSQENVKASSSPSEDGAAEGSSARAVTLAQQAPNQISNERVFTSNMAFTRTVYLPRPVDGSRVTARLSDGVLTLTLPKVEDKATVKVDVQ